ncbi:hypothetical protein GCM10028807_15130 [Spirosoma daeguense]
MSFPVLVYRCYVRWLLSAGVILCGLTACNDSQEKRAAGTVKKQEDSLRFFRYLNAGDSVYSTKKGYTSFATSLTYYDSAQTIADRSGDTLLLAEAIFAKGRVHDAWNKEPQKTIAYFKQATALFKKLPTAYKRYLYAKHLVAHAYDKVLDSTNASLVLTELFNELKSKDTTLLRSTPLTAEMALIATEVRAYPLADSILNQLSRRQWIRNDPDTYDYLNHYYLTQSRLDVFWRNRRPSDYVDSLQQVLRQSTNVMDSLYYSENLARLLAVEGRFEAAYQYKLLEDAISKRLNQHESIADMQQALLRSELLAEKRKLEYRETIRETRLTALWILGALLAVITGLSVYLYRRNKTYRIQSLHLLALNSKLDEKVVQVELLNKEIQHRIKNNLQIIYSLLQMQERKSEHEETIENLQMARLRVESIAALHNQLANNEQILDIAGYSKALISAVVACFSIDKQVVTHIDSTSLKLPQNHYLPLSLILTEWVINSIKHAATKNGILEINVAFKHQQGQFCLDYSDNGQCTKEMPVSSWGLGNEIVTLLCRQLNGVLTAADDNPYHYTLCFDNG